MTWPIFTRDGAPHDRITELPTPPPWRQFDGEVVQERPFPKNEQDETAERSERAQTFQVGEHAAELVNAALFLRRPLLVTGKPGTGKSSLVHAVARQLRLGQVLRWPITSRSNVQEALYQYDAIGRLQEAQLQGQKPDISRYIQLGPLGTALLPTERPRALLIDEIDKGDIDLPNDLLNVFEEGEFVIPELARLDEETVSVRAYGSDETYPISRGRVRCREFPFVVLTSNGEREFPAPFLRRCIRLGMEEPGLEELEAIVRAHLGPDLAERAQPIIENFLERRSAGTVATDQLLNAVFLLANEDPTDRDTAEGRLMEALLSKLDAG
jgi:MoxR-like ATPase